MFNAKGGYRRRAIHPRPKETGFFANLDKIKAQQIALVESSWGLFLLLSALAIIK